MPQNSPRKRNSSEILIIQIEGTRTRAHKSLAHIRHTDINFSSHEPYKFVTRFVTSSFQKAVPIGWTKCCWCVIKQPASNWKIVLWSNFTVEFMDLWFFTIFGYFGSARDRIVIFVFGRKSELRSNFLLWIFFYKELTRFPTKLCSLFGWKTCLNHIRTTHHSDTPPSGTYFNN